jgi:putative protease
MKILAPLSREREVEVLAKCGADEFYTGVMPREWIERFSTSVWPNRRGPFSGNFNTIPELNGAIRTAHLLGKAVYIVFNSPYYTLSQINVLIPLVRELVQQVEPDGLIVGDVGLILAMRESGIDLQVIVSTLAVAHNVESIRFFRSIGASRVILPRQMSISEIRALRPKVTDVEIEAFILNDTCVFQEGHCHTQHNLPNMESFCYTPWEYRTLSNVDLRPVDGKEEEEWCHHLEDYREWLWYCKNCGYSMTLRGLTNGACGLCAIYKLVEAGVDAVKIVGRESSLDRKAKSVIVVRKVLDRVLSGASEGEAMREARNLRNTPELCGSGYMCYYRDALSGEKEAKPGAGYSKEKVGG